MHAGTAKNFCRDTNLAPGSVRDALPLPVFGGRIHECGLKLVQVDTLFDGVETSLERLSLLQQVQTLQRVGARKLFFNRLQLGVDVFRVWLASTARLICFKGLKVTANSQAFGTAGSKRRFVLIRHRRFLARWCHSSTMPHRTTGRNTAIGEFSVSPPFRNDQAKYLGKVRN